MESPFKLLSALLLASLFAILFWGWQSSTPRISANTVFFRDEFNDAIDDSWQVLNQDDGYYTMASDHLAVRASAGDLWQHQNNYRNLFLIDTPTDGDFDLTMRIKSFDPFPAHASQINLVAYDDDDNHARAIYGYPFGAHYLEFGVEEAGIWSTTNDSFPNALTPMNFGTEPFYLRMRKIGNTYQQYYSTDGVSFMAVNAPISFGDGTPAQVGFVVMVDPSESSIAEIDWIEISAVPGLSSAAIIGSFDLSRGQGFSLAEGDLMEQARETLAEAYPDITHTVFPTLTESILPDVDILFLSVATTANSAITPLSSAEQTVLTKFVSNGGCAVLLVDNDSFDPQAPLANESLIDPFGLAVEGTIAQVIQAPVTNPSASTITNGPHGTVTHITQPWPGGLTDLGPYATSLATNGLGDALAVIPPSAINAYSGPVVVFTDAGAFADTTDNGHFIDNTAVFLNTINFCLSVPPAPTPTPSPTATALPSPTPTATPALDLSIDKIEITQGIQCLDNPRCTDNSVPLIAGKTTYVRLYIKVDGTSAPVPNVAANVSVQVDGGTYQAISMNQPITAPLNADRAVYSDTLNFYLQPDVIDHTTTLTAHVNPQFTVSENNYGNNTRTASLNFVKTPDLYIVPIWVKAKNHQTGRTHQVHPWMNYYLTEYAENLLPVGRIQWLIPANPFLTWNNPTNTTTSDWGKLLGQLTDLRKKNFAARVLGAHYYGFVSTKVTHGGTAGYGGYNSKVAAGQVEEFNTDLENKADVLVHELGHNFDRRHVSCGVTDDLDMSYPYNVNTIGDFGWDPQGASGGKVQDIPGGFVVPRNTADVMSYCQDEWISEYTYRAILNYRGSTPATRGQSSSPAAIRLSSPMTATAPYLYFSGLLIDDEVTLLPASILEQPTGLDDDPGDGDYAIRQIAADSSILYERHFDLGELHGHPEDSVDHHLEEAGQHLFYEIMPWMPETSQIELWHEDALLATQTVSANAPEITITAGRNRWTANDDYTIVWEASDLDGDTLSYDVAFSADGGDSWQMIATQLVTPSLTINGGDFPGTDTAVLRIYVTDGVLTTAATGTPFTIEDKAPTVVIVAPDRETAIPVDLPLLLKGLAYDWEDGMLASAAFRWHSSLDGDIGEGAEQLVMLSKGSHLIQVAVTDSDGREGTAQTWVHVGVSEPPAVYLPLVQFVAND